MCLKIVLSEHDFYSIVFDSYSKLESSINDDDRANFFQDSFVKLLEVARELDNDVFLQNAMMIMSCLYHDKNIDHYESESQNLEALEEMDKELARSLILKALE